MRKAYFVAFTGMIGIVFLSGVFFQACSGSTEGPTEGPREEKRIEKVEIDAYLDDLISSDEQERNSAVAKLVEAGEPVVEPLIAALEAKDTGWLTAIGILKEMAAAVKIFTQETKKANRNRLGSIYARDVLKNYLDEMKALNEKLMAVENQYPEWDTEYIPREVNDIVKRLDKELYDSSGSFSKMARMLRSQDVRDHRGKIRAYLQPIKDRIKDAKEESEEDPFIDDNLYFRRAALKVLERIRSEEAVEFLTRVMNDDLEDEEVRETAVAALGKIPSKDAVRALVKCMDDEYGDMEHRAVRTLEAMEPGVKEDILINVLLKSRKMNTRSRAAHLLGEMRSEKAIVPLLMALENCKSKTRQEIALALEKIGSEEVVDRLIDVFEDKGRGYNARSLAARVLGRLEAGEAVDALVESLESKNSSIGMSAARALVDIKSKKEDIEEELIDMVEDGNKYGRERACFVLGELRSEAAVDVLISATEDKEKRVRQWALKALKRIGTDKALTAIADYKARRKKK